MKGKEIALIVSFATMLVALTYVFHHARIVTGIRGISYLFTIFGAIPVTAVMLCFQGRRWRFLSLGCLVGMMVFPSHLHGAPFDPTKLIYLLVFLVTDVVFNTFHDQYQKRGRLLIWAILFANTYYLMRIPLTLLRLQLFFSPIVLAMYIKLMMVMVWIIVGQATLGAYLGYRIYKRIGAVL